MPYYRFSYIDEETRVVGFSLLEFHDDPDAIAHVDVLHARGRLGVEVWDRGRLIYRKVQDARRTG